MSHTREFLKAMKVRRSTYTLTPESTLTDAEIGEIIQEVLENAPSTFSSYTTRVVLALKDEHYKLWDAITDTVKAVTPADKYESHTKARLEGFRNAYGTVLFFEDPQNTEKLQEQFAFAKDKFPVWAEHTSAIHQFATWTALTNAGMGANLQHYNPLIDDKVRAMFHLPQRYRLIAQLVFGKPSAPAGPKPEGMKAPMEERFRVFGASTPVDALKTLNRVDSKTSESSVTEVQVVTAQA